jgi:hypothetical protein
MSQYPKIGVSSLGSTIAGFSIYITLATGFGLVYTLTIGFTSTTGSDTSIG